ncbi:MAG: hypothetical protein VKL59_06140 [Nostocaceae cyanobacterium]|nr:hypothetical protein [Nostocaceae cyanobacterium]
MAKKKSSNQVIGLYEGVSAGLKFWLFFILAFYFLLGYSPYMSILLGGLGGLAGGWIYAWWNASEEAKTQQQVEELEKTDSELSKATLTKLSKGRGGAITRRYRRTSPSWQFWKRS